jgi:protein-S-isoprenylcysteine O-methyltransferase Ste14
VNDTVAFRLWPPVALGVPLLAGAAATAWWGDPAPLPAVRVPVGVVLLIAFTVWNGWSLRLFRRHRTGLLPGQPTREVIQSGPFSRSRNPLYVGLVVLYVAICLLLPSLWGLLVTPVAVLLVTVGAIRPEEQFLRQRFGDSYAAYAAHVRRWL